MRRHKILNRIILILFIIGFTLAAPAAVRERAEVRLDANAVTTALQKRLDPLAEDEPERAPPNVPGLDHAPPPRPDPTDRLSHMLSMPSSQIATEQLLGKHRHADRPPPNPGWRTGSRLLPVGSRPTVGALALPPRPSRHPSQPGPSKDSSPVPLGPSVEPDTSSTGSNETPPQSPGSDPEVHSPLNPEPIPSASELWDEILKGKIKRRMSNSDAVN